MDILDDNGNYKNTYEILLEISKIYKEIQAEDKKFGTNRASALIEELAGKNMSNIAASILENSQMLEEVFKSSQDSAGSAMEENEKWLDSIEGKTEQFTNQLQKLANELVSSDLIKGAVDFGTGALKFFDNIIEKFGALKGVVTVTSGALAGSVLWKLITKSSFSEDHLVGLLNLFSKGGNGILSGIKSAKKGIEDFSNTVYSFQLGGMETLPSVFEAIKTSISGLLSSPFAPLIAGAIAAVGAIKLVRVAIDEANGTASAKRAEKAWSEYETASDELQSVQTEIDNVKSKIDELNAKGGLTLVEQGELDKLQASYETLLLQEAALEKQKDSSLQTALQESGDSFRKKSKANIVNEHRKAIGWTEVPYGVAEPVYAEDDPYLINAYEEAIKVYEDAQEARQKFIDTADKESDADKFKKDLDSYDQDITDASVTLATYEADLLKLYSNLKSVGQENTPLFDNVASTLQMVMDVYEPGRWQQIQEQALASMPNLAKQRETLVNQAKETGKVSSQDAQKLAADYLDAYKKAGLTEEQLMNSVLSEAGVINYDELIRQSLQKIDDDALKSEIENYLQTLNNDELNLIMNANVEWGKVTVEDLTDVLNAGQQEQEVLFSSILSNETFSNNISERTGAIQTLVKAQSDLSKSGADTGKILKTLYESDIPDSMKDTIATSDNLDLAIQQLLNTADNSIMDSFADQIARLEESGNTAGADALRVYADSVIEAAHDIEKASGVINGVKFETPSLNAANDAQSSANDGNTYESYMSMLAKAKELADKGLTGTDDFKTIAKMLSANGMDDYANFVENLSMAERYLTEDDKGVKNFLEDLKSNGLAEFNDETKEWTYNLKDLEEAANSMGMPLEMMEAMFGRLSDYNFSNNFFNSVEEGQEHLSNLTDDLETEEAKLEYLQHKKERGDETVTDTVLEAQQAKVDRVRSDIEQTEELLEYLNLKTPEAQSDFQADDNHPLKKKEANEEPVEEVKTEAEQLEDAGISIKDNIEAGAEALGKAAETFIGDVGKKLNEYIEENNPLKQFEETQETVNGIMDAMTQAAPDVGSTMAESFVAAVIGSEIFGKVNEDNPENTTKLPTFDQTLNGEAPEINKQAIGEAKTEEVKQSLIQFAEDSKTKFANAVEEAKQKAIERVLEEQANTDLENGQVTDGLTTGLDKKLALTHGGSDGLEDPEPIEVTTEPSGNKLFQTYTDAYEHVADDISDNPIEVNTEQGEGNQPTQQTTTPTTSVDTSSSMSSVAQLQSLIAQTKENSEIDLSVVLSGNYQLVDEVATEIANLPEEKQIEVGVNAENVGNVEGIASQLTENPDGINLNAVVTYTKNSDEPDKYKPADKKATVKYNKDSSIPDGYTPDNKVADVDYSANLSSLPTSDSSELNRTAWVTYKKRGGDTSDATGTATLASGTAGDMWTDYRHSIGAYAGGTNHDWALPHDEVALVNEEGNESIVLIERWVNLFNCWKPLRALWATTQG